MGRKFAMTLLFGAAVLAVAPSAGGRADDADKPDAPLDLARLRGMSQAQVRQFLGPAKRIARQILYRRYLEQWLYEGPRAVRIEFDCVRGNEPQILTVHALSPANP